MTRARTLLAWLAAGGILMVGFAWLAGWLNRRTAPGLDPSRAAEEGAARTVEVSSREAETFLPVPGRLWAAHRTRVTPEIRGKVMEVAVIAGDDVAAGDVLVKLDRTELAARVAQVEEQLPAEEQRVKEAQSKFDRDRDLLEKEAVSREELETSRRRLADAQAALAAMRQRLVEARARLDEATIKATMSGSVVGQVVKEGEVARPGRVLLELYQPDTLRLECAVPASLAERLQVGQSLRADFGSADKPVDMTIEEIVPQVDTSSRTVLVKARPNTRQSFFEGRYGRLFVPLGRRAIISVPAVAVRSVGQLDFVNVMTDEHGIERRFVRRGPVLPPDRIEILSGLDAGEQVVIMPVDGSSNADANQ